VAFSAGGDGGRKSPELLAAVLRFAFWLAAYLVLSLLLAMCVQSLGNWLLAKAAIQLVPMVKRNAPQGSLSFGESR